MHSLTWHLFLGRMNCSGAGKIDSLFCWRTPALHLHRSLISHYVLITEAFHMVLPMATLAGHCNGAGRMISPSPRPRGCLCGAAAGYNISLAGSPCKHWPPTRVPAHITQVGLWALPAFRGHRHVQWWSVMYDSLPVAGPAECRLLTATAFSLPEQPLYSDCMLWSFKKSHPQPLSGSRLRLFLPTGATAMGKKKPRVPPEPLDAALICKAEELTAGTDVTVVGGAHSKIHGYHAVILKSEDSDDSAFNVRVLEGSAEERRKVYTIDRAHVVYRPPQGQVQDDGLDASLRWRITPPPLTVYSARWLLGWQSLRTLVPPKPEKNTGSEDAQGDKAAADGEAKTRTTRLLPTPKMSVANSSATRSCAEEEWVEVEVDPEDPEDSHEAAALPAEQQSTIAPPREYAKPKPKERSGPSRLRSDVDSVKDMVAQPSTATASDTPPPRPGTEPAPAVPETGPMTAAPAEHPEPWTLPGPKPGSGTAATPGPTSGGDASRTQMKVPAEIPEPQPTPAPAKWKPRRLPGSARQGGAKTRATSSADHTTTHGQSAAATTRCASPSTGMDDGAPDASAHHDKGSGSMATDEARPRKRGSRDKADRRPEPRYSSSITARLAERPRAKPFWHLTSEDERSEEPKRRRQNSQSSRAYLRACCRYQAGSISRTAFRPLPIGGLHHLLCHYHLTRVPNTNTAHYCECWLLCAGTVSGKIRQRLPRPHLTLLAKVGEQSAF